MSSRPARRARVEAIERMQNDNWQAEDEIEADLDSEASLADDIGDYEGQSFGQGDAVPHENVISSSDDDDQSISDTEIYVDKNGNRWNAEPQIIRGRRDAANVLRQRPGPTRSAHKDSLFETWSLFFHEPILRHVLECTRLKMMRDEEDADKITMDGLLAFISIFYFRGANMDKKLTVDDLWSEDTADFYNAAMSRNDFKKWLKYIRFDDAETRASRRSIDSFAAFRFVFDSWNDRLNDFFTASDSLTIDEQLISSRTRSPHRIYNPKKPGKYGDMYRWIYDSKFRYVHKGNPDETPYGSIKCRRSQECKQSQ